MTIEQKDALHMDGWEVHFSVGCLKHDSGSTRDSIIKLWADLSAMKGSS